MKITTVESSRKDGSGLGEPFDERSKLLIAWEEADKALKAAQACGDRDAIHRAELAVTARLADIESHERHQANSVLMSLKFALKHDPTFTSAVFSDVPVIIRLAEAVAALESKGVR